MITRDRRLAIYLILGIFIFFNILKLVILPHFSWEWHVLSGVLGFIGMIPIALAIWWIDQGLDRYYPYENNLRQRIFIQLLLTVLIIFIIRYLFFLTFRQFIPIEITKELLIFAAIIHILFVATVILTIFLLRFFNKWRETDLKKEMLETEKATVQYDNLKNQLNPHFLFNSLTSLNSLIFENPQLASEFLQQLSKVYRYVLDNKHKTLVSLETEISFVDNYIRLLKSRFDKGLEVEVNISKENAEKQILPVTLQILIENAIKHNSTGQSTPLRISITTHGDYLIVSNNLQLKKVIEHSNKQGLENLRNLYSVLIEKVIEIESTAYSFSVKIPLI